MQIRASGWQHQSNRNALSIRASASEQWKCTELSANLGQNRAFHLNHNTRDDDEHDDHHIHEKDDEKSQTFCNSVRGGVDTRNTEPEMW